MQRELDQLLAGLNFLGVGNLLRKHPLLRQGDNGSTELVQSCRSCGQGLKEQRGTLTASLDCRSRGSEPSSETESESESLLLELGINPRRNI